MSKFQFATIGLFIFFIILGVIFFATYKQKGGQTGVSAPITIWGTFPADKFRNLVNKINQGQTSPLNINYVEKTEETFSREFTSALSRGTGPDGILIPAELIVSQTDLITVIPFEIFPERQFKDTFIQQGELYLTTAGILSIPFVVDPLVMYWNRDLYSAAGLASYPKFWEDFPTINNKLTVKSSNGTISKATIALGNFSNVANAREILGSLLLQSGNPVTVRDVNGVLESTLKTYTFSTAEKAVQYFTQFVNPNNTAYSWNGSMPNSKTAFLSGTLATYLGFASEIRDIRAKNPNLNFDAALLPQWKNTSKNIKEASYGRMYGLSIVRASGNQNNTLQIFGVLTTPQNQQLLREILYLPSVRRDLIAAGSNDPYMSIFNEAALVSTAWLDIDRVSSYRIFANMTSAITSGAKSVREAVNDASDQHDVVLRSSL